MKTVLQQRCNACVWAKPPVQRAGRVSGTEILRVVRELRSGGMGKYEVWWVGSKASS
jgi:hypothetical protein